MGTRKPPVDAYYVVRNHPAMSEPRRPLSDDERLDWLQLIRSRNVGPVGFHQLLARFGTAAAALEALPALARRAGAARTVRVAARETVEREMEAAHRAGARLIASIEPDYPEPLAAIEDAPPIITVKGDVSLAHRSCCAMVGARNASAAGLRFTREVAAALGAAGLTVVSGLARGIDGAAHGGSLATGTVAVLGGGIDVPYPNENAKLYAQIAERGLLIAETPVGTQPQARHFPRRNRLISGLSLGVLVVEAALRSGSLITARMALEQGREVFAVPGSPLDPRCRGTNRLIRDSAVLTESADDVLKGIRGMVPRPRRPTGPQIDLPMATGADRPAAANGHAALTDKLGPTPVHVDELVRLTGLSAQAVATALLELELAGKVERHPGNKVSAATATPTPSTLR